MEARISTSALATPPRKRRIMKAMTDVVSPIAAVVAALNIRAAGSQMRWGPGRVARVAPRAPIR